MSENTYFAPAERSTISELRGSATAIEENPLISDILKTFASIVAVLNSKRQIIAINDKMLHFMGLPNAQTVFGLRPGEALNCVHSNDSPGGCGTSKFCTTCGAAIAIVLSQETSEPVERECLLTMRGDPDVAIEFCVRAAPLQLGDEQFTMLLLKDIRDKKRKEALEQIFFHDLMNTMTGLSGYTELIKLATPENQEKIIDRIDFFSSKLIEEIRSQRVLNKVEAGDYHLEIKKKSVAEMLTNLEKTFDAIWSVEGRMLAVLMPEEDETIETDQTLLYRILTNMIKNALEATPKDEEVKLWCEASPKMVEFKVWNAGEISEEVAMRIFQRYFSTKKEPGRGLGTYSMKLFGQHFLKGKVTFTTSATYGTTFTLQLLRYFPLEVTH